MLKFMSKCSTLVIYLSMDLAQLSFALWTVAKLLCSSLCLFDAIVELHAMDEELFNNFCIIEK